MSALDPKLRRQLENVVKEARDVAEAGARDALQALTVHEAKRGNHLSDQDADLRNRLRIHGRQLGDQRRDNGSHAIDRLINECAYEHWNRMLFSRFLAANDLLVEPQSGMSVSLEDVAELAAEESADPWEMAASFATGMLPQIFRVDSPVLSLSLPREQRKRLEDLLESLPHVVFTASDSLGWVYQFWQTNEKKRINESEVKIGARELPAVTQLFTEPYMVSFLLDNSLGAWWAARRLTEEDLQTASSEQALRTKGALPGVPLEYLRFVRTPSGDEGEGEENTGPWTPAAGTFDAWPDSLSELKTLDPCCGSGHFLVAALLMLTPMRMEMEGLSATEAVDRVLGENLHGLEIDQRCVELAAFALALAAWRFPEAGGYRVLPDLNVACCGLSVSVGKEEWKALAGDNKQLRIALDWMYDEFKDAPLLGSFINPKKGLASRIVKWEELSPLVNEVLTKEGDSLQHEIGVVAHGLLRSTKVATSTFDWIITNVPYKKAADLDEQLQEFIDLEYEPGKRALETAFTLRCLELLKEDGVVSAVLPQNWTFLKTYEDFRNRVLNRTCFHFVTRLGAGAFREISGEVVKAVLISQSKRPPDNETEFFSLDTAQIIDADDKAKSLIAQNPKLHNQLAQESNPDSRIILDEVTGNEFLETIAGSYVGLQNGDTPRFVFQFWEIHVLRDDWAFFQMPCDEMRSFDGLTSVLYWQQGLGVLRSSPQAYIKGTEAWDKKGIAIRLTKPCPCALYSGELYDQSSAAIIPSDQTQRPAVWEFCNSDLFRKELEKIDQKRNVTNATFVKVPFDLAHWQEVASEKYPHGLPEPYSDVPTQWIFHGHPASSTDGLQVAVARLLGYRWPAELDAEMELATDARAWVERTGRLTELADNDGIVCIPAVGTEQPADNRLLNLLHRAYEEGRAQEQVFSDKLDAADEDDPVTVDLWRRDWQPSLPDSFPTWRDRLLEAADHKGKPLESWLREKFFDQHCKLFHHRPFVWQIWDGHRDGFSALVNYHKLAGPNGKRLLEKLTHSYLGDWINRQQDEVKRGVEGVDARLIAARALKSRLELILQGEPPYDIFVRWKPLHEQPIGWEPDLNDGVRMNIRPFMAEDIAGGKKGAGILRIKPNIKWTKDRGKEVEKPVAEFPWLWSWDGKSENFAGGKKFTAERWNDLHYTVNAKQTARAAAKSVEAKEN